MSSVRYILTLMLLLFAMGVQAQECKVLKREPGSITFVVDEDLPAPSQDLQTAPKNSSSEELVRLFRGKGKECIVAKSFDDATLNVQGRSPFFNMMVNAFADHRAIELTPDVVWLLISQAFSHHIGQNPEQYRHLLVNHEERMPLTVETLFDIRSEEIDWNDLIDNLTKQISDNTRKDIAAVVTADFSTTGSVERMASQVTLMDAVKWYFEYRIVRIVCGIPQVTLKGTPEDWTRVREKAMKLSDYGLKWWIDALAPILTEFENTAKGKPNLLFWKNMVREVRMVEKRGAGCHSSGENESQKVDGWFLKLLPFDQEGLTPQSVGIHHAFIPETVQVPFKYIELTPDHSVATPMELWAGLMGYAEDPKTRALSMQIGWLVRDASGDPKELKNGPVADYERGIIDITVEEVPEWLANVKSVKKLSIHFKNKVVIPEWIDHIQIGTFCIHGNLTPEEETALKCRFKEIEILKG